MCENKCIQEGGTLFKGFVYLGERYLKVASVCHLGPEGCRCTMWRIIDLWSQWSVPSTVYQHGPDGTFSPGPGVINVPSRWGTMPQPSSSHQPLEDTCCHCTLYIHVTTKKNTNSQCSDRQIKTISSEVFWTQTEPEGVNTPLSLARFAKSDFSLMFCIIGH